MFRILSYLVLIHLLVVASLMQGRRLHERRRAWTGGTAYAGSLVGTPPALNVVLVGLGGFRGLVAEVLWFRASRLQDQGRYVELVMLSEWITRLDPHATEAWTYMAWNLAYNVSVMMPDDEARWRWVQSGIRLLRDDGLRFNPGDPRLCRELAWLFQSKIGADLDASHRFYKFSWARTMAPLTGEDGTLRDTPETRLALQALRLEPEAMLALQRRFGPLDWRLPESHALYWASQGLAAATPQERGLLLRAMYQPLTAACFGGRFTGDLAAGVWRTAPNPALLPGLLGLYEETLSSSVGEEAAPVYARLLMVLIAQAHGAGDKALAENLLERLRRLPLAEVATATLDDVLRTVGKDRARRN